MVAPMVSGLQKTTNYKVVLPFYIYAAFGLLGGTLLLFFSTGVMAGHHFNPPILALTHTLALAWGTMIIIGASHQLLPVLLEGELDSDLLGYLTFGFSALGIPLLVYGFYVFDLGLPLQLGAMLINLGVLCYLSNVLCSAFKRKVKNPHAWYVLAASLWLFSTTFFGLLLALNFRMSIFSENSVDYLSIHAHMGIVGWFLLMVVGVGTRLIPMFMISKYTNERALWWIFALLNAALISFFILFLAEVPLAGYGIPVMFGVIAIAVFLRYLYRAYMERIRRRIDRQVKTALISVVQMLLPLIALIFALTLLPTDKFPGIALIYGFCIFFGWLTAIILGMTFKTMPFIIWNKVYSNKGHQGRTPAPKELFHDTVYRIMWYAYLIGFILFILGLIIFNQAILKSGALALIIAAILYVYNVLIVAGHKSKQI